jgi:hypothetical protein
MPATRSVRITDTIAWLPVAFTMPGHSPLDAMTAAVADLSTALRTLSTDESTLLRDAPAGPALILSATIQLLRDMFQPTDIAPLANTLNVPACQFPQPVVVAPPAPPISAVEHPAPVQRVVADQPLAPIAPLSPPPIGQPIPDVPEASGSPQAPTPPPNTPAQDDSVLDKGATATRRQPHNHQLPPSRQQGRQWNLPHHSRSARYISNVRHTLLPCPLKHGHRVQSPLPLACARSASGLETIRQSAECRAGNNTCYPQLKRRRQLRCCTGWSTRTRMANDAEFRKLVTTSGTIAPIQKDAIPVDRRRNIAYYNPQVKEKSKTASTYAVSVEQLVATEPPSLVRYHHAPHPSKSSAFC